MLVPVPFGPKLPDLYSWANALVTWLDDALTRLASTTAERTGTIIIWPKGALVPSDCLECLGQTVSKTTFAALYKVVGNAYATGAEPAGTFRLPGYGLAVPFNPDFIGAKCLIKT